MKNLFLILFLSITYCHAQIVKIIPASASGDKEIELIFDATQGTAGLKGAASVYFHSGVIVSGPTNTDWEYVKGNWAKDDGIGKMTKVPNETDKWSIKLSPSIREYYKVPADKKIFRLSMVFRNADGSKEGKGTPGTFSGGSVAANQDIFIDLTVDDYVQLIEPTSFNVFKEKGKTVLIKSQASLQVNSLEIAIDNGTGLKVAATKMNTNVLEFEYKTDVSQVIKVKTTAIVGNKTLTETKNYNISIRGTDVVSPLPANLKKGINYSATDKTKATLVLEAPKKSFVYVVGDFNTWQVNDNFLMKKTPDGELFWLEINNLDPGKEYVFQYWVDGTIKIGDPYSDKVADPFNDKFIDFSVYPNAPLYSQTENGIATTLQTNQTAFKWEETEKTWVKPKKTELIIYELLIRDFIGSHSYKDLTDTLSYLKNLGVNAIELMPIMEFEGNESWGYNPSYFFAPDKYYGTKNALKNFIQQAHKQGVAVILDMVLNHAFGQNPNVKMYWDAQNNKPASNNPWFNPDATHPYSVGYDFNHESKYTQAFVDSVNNYWIKEYHFDGFRFDLSKGFTQTKNTDVGVWSKYDASRIAILKRMANKIKTTDKDAYIILEHFADAAEETELANEGMLLWGNNTFDYGNLLIGNTDANINSAENLNKVAYMESHDEERLMVKANNSTNSLGGYAINNNETALNRVKMCAAFFFPFSGPKMLWQFQELGYNVPIDFNGRVGNKPLVWGPNSLNLYTKADNKKLYDAHAAIIQLINKNRAVFTSGKFSKNLTGDIKSYTITHENLDVTVVGNFGLKSNTATIDFKKNGGWYDYFSTKTLDLSTSTTSITLLPGEFHIYTNKKQIAPKDGVVNFNPKFTVSPEEFTENTEITITLLSKESSFAATDKVLLVAGAVTEGPSGTDLKNTKKTEMLKNADGNWTIKLTPKSFFATEGEVFRVAMFFENADNTKTFKNGTSNFFLNTKSNVKIVVISPGEFQSDTEIKITFNATGGTAGLVGASKVYMHSGIITASQTGTEWQHVVGNWGKDDGIGKMTLVSPNKWEITIKPKDYYKAVPANASWFRIGMVFRNEDGTKEGKETGGKDIFMNFTPKAAGEILGIEPKTNVITLYPNPTNGGINIKIDEQIESLIWVNSIGQIAKTIKVTDNNGQLWVGFNEAPEAGTYILKIITKNKIITKKIVIMK
jgi:glycosidase